TMPSYLAISPPPFLSYRPRDHLDPPSFPTRRSSDLQLRNAPPAGASLQAHEARVVVEYLDRAHRRKVDDDTAVVRRTAVQTMTRSEEHTSELQSRENLVCRLLLETKNCLSNPIDRFE